MTVHQSSQGQVEGPVKAGEVTANIFLFFFSSRIHWALP